MATAVNATFGLRMRLAGYDWWLCEYYDASGIYSEMVAVGEVSSMASCHDSPEELKTWLLDEYSVDLTAMLAAGYEVTQFPE